MAARAPLNLAACRRRYRKQLRRYHRAIQDGHRARVHQLENWLLKSHTAKIVALDKAASNKAARSKGAQKKRFRVTPAKLDMMASTLSCWEDPTEPAVLHTKKKKSGGVRPIIGFGVMRTAQQYLAVGMLEPRLWLHEGQYAVPGRDRTAAIEIAKQLIRRRLSLGHPRGHYELLPLDERRGGPGKVAGAPSCIEEGYTHSSGGKGLLHPSVPPSLIQQVRRGLPPGAASTALVAAAALAPVLLELPDGVVVILYVDDFAIFAKSKAAAANAMNAPAAARRH